MTSTTMELLERVLRAQEDNVKCVSISEVADALHRFRVLGQPSNEIELIEAAEEYLKEAGEE